MRVLKSNPILGTKHSKTNQLQSTIEYKDYRLPNKWTENKILELKYGNTKLLGNTKYNQVKLIVAVFASAYLYQISNKLY